MKNAKTLQQFPGLVFILAVIALNLITVGCHSTYSRQNAAAKEFNKQRNQLYVAYLKADLPGARQHLLEMIQLGKSVRHIPPRAQANHLMRTYCWIYTLEERAGNEQLAGRYLEEAKHYEVQEEVLDGDSDSDIGESLKTFTKDRIISMVDNWDKGASGGKGPYYLLQLKSNKK
jgi:hypothetical protein